MTTFNFTIRAEDDQGAFTDRQFNIKVRNTLVDRYMVVNSTHAWTSVDLVTWTQRNNMGGKDCAYAGGQWLVWVSLGQYRLSPDGINFTNYAAQSNISGTTTAISFANIPQWNGDRWYAVDTSRRLHSSTDGVAWTYLSTLTTGFGSADPQSLSFGNGKIVAVATSRSINSMIVSSDGGLTWQTVTTPAGVFPATAAYINGLWLLGCTNQTASNVQVWYTPDMLNFYQGNMPVAARQYTPHKFAYVNGRIVLTFNSYDFTSGAQNMVFASDDAKNWSAKSGLGAVNNTVNTKMSFLATKGMILVGGQVPSIVGCLRQSSDMGETWANVPGIPFAVVNGIAMAR